MISIILFFVGFVFMAILPLSRLLHFQTNYELHEKGGPSD